MFLVNGVLCNNIPVSDRGFQYGDGVFETIEVYAGKPIFLERHLHRLVASCRKILIPPPEHDLLVAEALRMSAGVSHAVLKLIVTRGEGGRGYQQPKQLLPTRVLGLYPFPVFPVEFQTDGVITRFCQQRLANNPDLAGIKHMNRLEQILARAEWGDDDIQEGLMMDNQDFVIEGTMSNLFLLRDDILFTPNLSECGIVGIVREIIKELAKLKKLPIKEKKITKAVLLQADEIFITNSVIGIWPVKQIDVHKFNVGAKTKSLQKLFNAMRLGGT